MITTAKPEYVAIPLDAEYDLSTACYLPNDEDERAEIVAHFEAEFVRQANIVGDQLGIAVVVRLGTDEGLTSHPTSDDDWPTWEHLIWQSIHDRISVDRFGNVIGIDETPLVWGTAHDD